MDSSTENKSETRFEMEPPLTLVLDHELGEFFAGQTGTGGDKEVCIADDLNIFRRKEALSRAEIDIGTMKAGRLLVQEMSEKVCRELQPSVDQLLDKLSGLRLIDVGVALFWKRKEKVFLLSMSDTLVHGERRTE